MLPARLSFYDYPDHRDLHSFPTRRSSDLPGAGHHDRHSTEATDVGRITKSCFAKSGGCWECRNRSDRKSTRLNSSHTVISYAVFCLKKKSVSFEKESQTGAQLDEIGVHFR